METHGIMPELNQSDRHATRDRQTSPPTMCVRVARKSYLFASDQHSNTSEGKSVDFAMTAIRRIVIGDLPVLAKLPKRPSKHG